VLYIISNYLDSWKERTKNNYYEKYGVSGNLKLHYKHVKLCLVPRKRPVVAHRTRSSDVLITDTKKLERAMREAGPPLSAQIYSDRRWKEVGS
jgi:hypothetical protein